jgi:hypothetical protein
MKKNHLTKVLLGIAIVFAVIAGCGSDNDTPAVPTTPDETGTEKTKSFMFVQSATSGTFLPDGNGSYALTLNGVAPQTIYFSDRPVRDAGQIEMGQFLASGCFNSSNPPNVAIDVLGADQANDVVIVELTQPAYDAESATLRYTARILKDENVTFASLNTRRDASIPESFGSAALFIDDCSDVTIACGDKEGHKAGEVTCCTCWGGIVNGCDFQPDCCSFERCQRECTDRYGSENKYLYVCLGWWVDNYEDWESKRAFCTH